MQDCALECVPRPPRPRGPCHICRWRLQPIGHARKNGKAHPDWRKRRYHKKCWKKFTRELKQKAAALRAKLDSRVNRA